MTSPRCRPASATRSRTTGCSNTSTSLADPLAAADLVVARAGGSVFEIAAAGTPAILVPYPAATADHQTGNARWMEDAGAAVVLHDAELTAERLRARGRRSCSATRQRLEQMAAASRSLARPDAAARIADEVLAAIDEPPGARRRASSGEEWAAQRTCTSSASAAPA